MQLKLSEQESDKIWNISKDIAENDNNWSF